MHWRTLQKMLNHSEPPGYQQSQPRAKKKLAAYVGRIEQILKEDQAMPRKQRHTAKRIWERLTAEGFTGGYSPQPNRIRRGCHLTTHDCNVFTSGIGGRRGPDYGAYRFALGRVLLPAGAAAAAPARGLWPAARSPPGPRRAIEFEGRGRRGALKPDLCRVRRFPDHRPMLIRAAFGGVAQDEVLQACGQVKDRKNTDADVHQVVRYLTKTLRR